jgi:hypothetical protein
MKEFIVVRTSKFSHQVDGSRVLIFYFPSETLLALVEGEDYKQRAKDMVKEIGADKRL